MKLKNKLSDFYRYLMEGFEEVKASNPKLIQLSKFISKLFFAGIIFQVIIHFQPNFNYFQKWLAEITTISLNTISQGYYLQDITIIGNSGNSYVVTRDCTGWKSLAAFVSLIFASADKFLKYYRYLFVGGFLIILANIARLITTVFLSEFGLISFNIIHNFLWRWGLTGIVIILWFIWLKKGKIPSNTTNL